MRDEYPPTQARKHATVTLIYAQSNQLGPTFACYLLVEIKLKNDSRSLVPVSLPPHPDCFSLSSFSPSLTDNWSEKRLQNISCCSMSYLCVYMCFFCQPFGVNQPGPYVKYTTVDSNGYLKNASGKTFFIFWVGWADLFLIILNNSVMM